MPRRSGLRATVVVAMCVLGGAGALAGPGRAAARTARLGVSDEITGVSCAAPGDCTAVGDFTDGSGHAEVFAITQTRGRWGAGRELPGTTALGLGRSLSTTALSCGAPGNCTAFGSYRGPGNRFQAFLDSQRGGRWRPAREIPGTGALNAGGRAAVLSASCSSGANCTAVGTYLDGSGHNRAFVVDEAAGAWGVARPVPGIALSTDESAVLVSLSCASAGNCAAGGSYLVGEKVAGFVVDERGGHWGRARQVPRAASVGTVLDVTAVSCSSAGNCVAGGDADRQSFVASEVHGTWHPAAPVPGLAALAKQGATVDALSCTAPGDCSAGGSYTGPSPITEGPAPVQAFVVSERNGRWGKAITAPGTKALNVQVDADLTTMSCTDPGNCGAIGFYAGPLTGGEFLISQVRGAWHRAQLIPGLAALEDPREYVELSAISCTAPGDCAAGGTFGRNTAINPDLHALIVSEKHGVWGKAMRILGF